MNFLSLCSMLFILSLMPSYAKDYWGSITVSEKSGVSAGAKDSPSKVAAENKALAICKKRNRGASCVIGISFSNSCGAAAWSSSSKIAGGGWAESSFDLAKKNALERCSFKGGVNCQIVQAFCTTWETVESTLIWW